MSMQAEVEVVVEPKQQLRALKYVDALREAIHEEMARDDSVFLFGLDVDDHKGIQGSTLGLKEIFGVDRVFGTPLSEDAMTGIAIGAAMSGYRPIHVHIRMDFLLLCMNQLVNMAAKAHYMYDGQVNVPLVVRTMIGRSWGQGAQHSQALHAFFMHVPGIKVVAPSNAYDAKRMLKVAVRDNNPVIFIEHRLLYSTESYVPKEVGCGEFGKARVLKAGEDVTVVSISHMILEVSRAQKYLEAQAISAEVIDLISLKPLDIDTVTDSVRKTGKLLVVDNGWLTCGMTSEIITRVIEQLPNGVNGKPIQFARMGFAETTCPTTRVLEDLFYPNGKTIAERAYKLVHREAESGVFDELEVEAELTEVDAFKGPF